MKNFVAIVLVCLLGLILALAPDQAEAGFILRNTDGTSPGTGAVSGLSSYMIGFKIGSSPVTISSVNLQLSKDSGSPSVSVGILADNGSNLPTTTVVNLGSQSITNPATQNYAFSAPASSVLSADTTYWLSISGAATGFDVAGFPTFSSTPTSESLASYVDYRDGNFFTQIPLNVGAPSFEIVGSLSSVPEPSSVALVALAVGGFAWRRFRRRDRLMSQFKRNDASRPVL
ncbi:MAG: choice-of-anchor R domain-containing protein [Pirellulales bacterium]